MGIIICDKHGRTGIITGILKDICKKMSDNANLKQSELATIIVDYYDEGELLFSDKYLVTTEFKDNLCLDNHYKIYSEEDENLILKRVRQKMGAMCGKCYEEYLKRHKLKVDFK